MTVFTFTKIVSTIYEDGGQSMIVELTDDENAEEGIFIRVQSWSTTGNHVELEALVNTGMVVTINPVRFKERE
jgi:hypothetical protein